MRRGGPDTNSLRTRKTALSQLNDAFLRNGYWRGKPDPRRKPGTHRGYEARFSAGSAAERDAILRLLRAAGIKPGRPFAKGPSWRVPVYGKAQVQVLLDAFRRLRETGTRAPLKRRARARR
jgi:hypothetical protein